MAAQASLCLAWSETPEDTFSRDEAQMYIVMSRWHTANKVFIIAIVIVILVVKSHTYVMFKQGLCSY